MTKPEDLTLESAGSRMAGIIAALSNPACFPQPVTQVQVIQTHVSCVFLTGAYVYKVKKPVDFGFLDYSTLERRHHFCEEELRLNRRLCPDVYLDVLPVTRQDGCLRVGDTGELVEWALRMRQMRREDMLPARLESGTVGAQQIARIARVMADFHAHHSGGGRAATFGTPSAVARTVTAACAVMNDVACDRVPEGTRLAIQGYLERFPRVHEDLIQARRAAGRVQDCHGDLRTQNICLDARFGGGVQVFDCIEFSDALRYIDVAADLAYLAMDLDLAGRADLRQVLVDTYGGASGDDSLRQVLPYYQTYRAVVRGNIALLAASEREIPASDRAAHREVGEAAYDLACGYAWRRPRAALLIMEGFSGSGKSCLARELARRLPAVLLSSDRIRKEAAGANTETALGDAHYAPERREAVYARMRERAGDYLARNEHVLLDATFLSGRERQAAAELAARQGAEFWILQCHCPDELIRQRLRARPPDPNGSDAGLNVYEAQRRAFTLGVATAEGAGTAVAVDTGQPLPETVRRVIARFAEGP